MAASFVTEPPSAKQKTIVYGLSVLALLVTAVSWAYAEAPLVNLSAFLPFFGGVVFVVDVLTAYLMSAQFRIARRLSVLFLSSAYLFSGLVVIPQVLCFPGILFDVLPPWIGSQSAIWLWVCWHMGYPLLVLGYVSCRMVEGERLLPAPLVRRWSILPPLLIFALVLGLAAWVTIGHESLPELVSGRNFHSLSESEIAWTVLVLNGLALLGLIWVCRGQTVGELGLTLAAMAAFLDVVLTLRSGARYSLGWYVARLDSLVSSGAVLLVYLFEITWLYRRVSEFNNSLSRLAFLDQLTGLANRRQFDFRLEAEWNRAAQQGTSLALAMLDVDFFKKYNDHYGHVAGDECLRHVGRSLAGVARRSGDLAARYGGEEFALILPDSDIDAAQLVCHAANEAVRGLGISHAQGTESGLVTVSIGVVSLTPPPGWTLDRLKRAADEALYQAKTQGRNQTVAGRIELLQT